MDYLWTPWRYRYVTAAGADRPEAEDCAFCRMLAPGASDRDALIVHRADRNFVVLNRYPYTSGHMMVVPYRHVGAMADASLETVREMIVLTRRIETVLGRLYRPDGVNIGMNIGARGRRRHRRPHSHARPAPLDRRFEFRHRHRRDPGPARIPRGDLGARHGRLPRATRRAVRQFLTGGRTV